MVESGVKPENKKKVIKQWHTQHEVILKNWGECCACYRYLHYKSYQKYKKSSMRFTLPIIILSTITGTANFAQETFPLGWQSHVPSAIGALNLVAAIMTTVSQFLKVSEMLESHRVSSIHYGKLARNIRLELTLPVTERAHDGSNMVEICRAEYDRLIEQSPPVPKDVLEKFDRQFDVKNTKIATPEILTIKEIQPFDNIKAAENINKTVERIFNRRRSELLAQTKCNHVTVEVPPTDSNATHNLRSVINELENLKEMKLVTQKIDDDFLDCENDIFTHETIQTPTNSSNSECDENQQNEQDEVKTEPPE